MGDSALSRRTFLEATAAAAATVMLPTALRAVPRLGAPAVLRAPAARAVAVSSANGLRAVTRAVELAQQGTDTLDAAVAGVKIVELDPDDSASGGGAANERGALRLDASCMHGPTRRAGAVAALEGIRTPSEVAKLVLQRTDHVLLVGQGATRFALSCGFKEEDLLTAGTIHLGIVNAGGDISSVTSASGPAWKIPGRSPIMGAGQYTDNEIGAAGSTGQGESTGMVRGMVCGGFLTVEGMRRGLAPTDACRETLERVVATTPARLRDERGRPSFDLSFYAVNKRGDFGAASLYPGRYAVHDGLEAALRDTAYLHERPAQ